MGGVAVEGGSISLNFTPDVGFTEIIEGDSQPGNAQNRMSTGAFKIATNTGNYNITGTLT